MFFSKKFPTYGLVNMGSVDANVDPDFGAYGLYYVDVRPVKWSDTARGRLAIVLGLTGISIFCSVCAVSPAWRATLTMWSLTRSCRLV